MSWEAELRGWRQRKDAHFAACGGPASAPLSYYPPDPAWRLTLPLTPLDAEPLTLQTSSGETLRLLRVARVALPCGEELTLLRRESDPPQRAFLPFRDATSGSETYGVGRYLDAEITSDG